MIDDIGFKLGISCIMVSHDAPDILSWAGAILVMKEGELIQEGTPDQIYHRPVNEYCAGLFGEYNLFNKAGAALLSSSAIGVPKNKKLFVRPEQLMIHTKGNGLKGTVQKILFLGSCYAIDVKTASQLVRIKTYSNVFSVGQTVFVSLLQETGWYL